MYFDDIDKITFFIIFRENLQINFIKRKVFLMKKQIIKKVIFLCYC